MKIYIFMIPYLFLSILVLSQENQNAVRIYYDVTFQKDSNDVQSVIHEQAELMIAGQTSYFIGSQYSLYDSIKYLGLGEEHYQKPNTPQPYRIWKDFETEQIFYYETFILDIYGYQEPMSAISWEILSDTMTVNGMLCQKAKTAFGNRVWYAWFNPEIPIFDGPYKFSGLPGLVVQVKDSTDTWLFSMTGMVEAKGLVLDFPFLSKSTQLGKQEFYKSKKETHGNHMQLLFSTGLISVGSKEVEQEMIMSSKKALQKMNNWIELYP